MKFSKLHSDIPFECINDSMGENTVDIFARKLCDNFLMMKDFESKWEQDKRSATEPKEVCLSKGVSVHKFQSDEVLVRHYADLHKIAPRYVKERCYCKFRFRGLAGMLWFTGLRNKRPLHFTFFKSDDFNLEMLDILEIKGF